MGRGVRWAVWGALMVAGCGGGGDSPGSYGGTTGLPGTGGTDDDSGGPGTGGAIGSGGDKPATGGTPATGGQIGSDGSTGGAGVGATGGRAGNFGTGGTLPGGAGGVTGASGGTGGVPVACAIAGGACLAPTQCCAGNVCVADPTVGPVCAASCAGNSGCQSGCCALLQNGARACGPVSLCAAPPPAGVILPPGCGRLILRGNDGQFLGVATGNQFAADSVCNSFSLYGSQFSATSIFNQFSLYGSSFSVLSAYSEFTATPPVLQCETSMMKLNPVTKNKFLASPIDPDVLCAALTAAGL
ncbi:MAG: hypothetical protein ABJA82_01875 [Myxococcales bacterium]